MATQPCYLCGRTRKVARRTTAGTVCDACYNRDFCSATCSACGSTTRSYRGETPAYCGKCAKSRVERHCGTCGGPLPRATWSEGAAQTCARCRRLASPPLQCSVCGRASRHLLSGAATKMKPMCRRCAHPGKYATCSVCRHFRIVAGCTEAQRPVCRQCQINPVITCQECNKLTPRFLSTLCGPCSRRKSLISRFHDHSGAISTNDFKQLFEAFGAAWLSSVNTGGITSRHLLRVQAFFQRLADHLTSVAELKTASLLEYFTAHELQQNFHIASWLIDGGWCRPHSRLEVDDAAESLAQEKIIKKVQPPWKRDLLIRFQASLRRYNAAGEKRGWTGEDAKLKTRTMTLLLRAAWRFLDGLSDDVVSVQSIDQGSVDTFVVEHPGHRASFNRFIRYINQEEARFNRLLVLPFERHFPGHLLHSPDQANALLARWLTGPTEAVRDRLLCILMLLFGRQAKAACSLRRLDFSLGPKGTVEAHFGKVPADLPEPIAKLLRQHIGEEERQRGRQLIDEDYLFPGRTSGQPMHPCSLRPFTSREGVSARSLYTTSIAGYYREGLRLPTVLSRTLGITKVTAIKYYQAFAPELTDEALIRAGRR